MRLADKVALITGGTGGMGSASARRFAQEGAAVVITARHEGPGHELVREITDGSGRATLSRWTPSTRTTGTTPSA
jgi:NAD(P)-dependent dehydrogenase (short-subunit alcohol dehydrogenase family)